ncbi:MAG: HAD-IIIA family hydrolase [Alphaproteobacteria bacterium]|nr:HAD-IIIA family hydrolase [Alphaproteobacteria bacterium]
MRLALLDRDGVLNHDRPDSVRRAEDLILIPGAAAAVARLNAADWRVAVVTNQAVVGRGFMSPAELERTHAKLAAELAAGGAHLDAVIACTDAPENATVRRKPGPGMLLEALDRFGATPETTPMIGDSLRDLEAAARAGCRRFLVRTGKGRATEDGGLPAAVQPVVVVDDLGAAVDILFRESP